MMRLWELTTVDNFVPFKLLVVGVKPEVLNSIFWAPLQEPAVLSPTADPSGRREGAGTSQQRREERKEHAVYTLTHADRCYVCTCTHRQIGLLLGATLWPFV